VRYKDLEAKLKRRSKQVLENKKGQQLIQEFVSLKQQYSKISQTLKMQLERNSLLRQEYEDLIKN